MNSFIILPLKLKIRKRPSYFAGFFNSLECISVYTIFTNIKKRNVFLCVSLNLAMQVPKALVELVYLAPCFVLVFLASRVADSKTDIHQNGCLLKYDGIGPVRLSRPEQCIPKTLTSDKKI